MLEDAMDPGEDHTSENREELFLAQGTEYAPGSPGGKITGRTLST